MKKTIKIDNEEGDNIGVAQVEKQKDGTLDAIWQVKIDSEEMGVTSVIPMGGKSFPNEQEVVDFVKTVNKLIRGILRVLTKAKVQGVNVPSVQFAMGVARATSIDIDKVSFVLLSLMENKVIEAIRSGEAEKYIQLTASVKGLAEKYPELLDDV